MSDVSAVGAMRWTWRELVTLMTARPRPLDAATVDALVDALAQVVRHVGPAGLRSASWVLPDDRHFPEPWTPRPEGAGWLAQRLLEHAGMGHFAAWVEVRGAELQPARYLGTDDGLVRLRLDAWALEDGPALVAPLCTEVVRAWAELVKLPRLHPIVGDGEGDPRQERLVLAAATHLGLAPLLASAGCSDDGMQANEVCAMLALQLLARGPGGRLRRDLLSRLEAGTCAQVRAQLAVLEPHAGVFRARLGLAGAPSATAAATDRAPLAPLRSAPVVCVAAVALEPLWPVDDLYGDELTTIGRRVRTLDSGPGRAARSP
jgi:hypothetical protein